ncbi:hypothetical protein VW23_004795 [Devosia insulae DS-56]|uniref:Glycosyltransferase RgtA/B/C/D-like domain-containing protein n=1 Tax=Devosia insulae DS-56 TaxID=1116389 RepID=A0A1E5XIL9_9HYPH|nr:hypothetical protein VW23_004795 [Devosia insulae DS-56]
MQQEAGIRLQPPELGWRHVLPVTLAVFAIYAASTWMRTLPVISQDELGFIAQSQLLAGVPAVNMGSAPYYHFGYSLLLTPVWWVTRDPLLAYKGFMLINAALAALLVPLLVGIAAALGYRRNLAMVAAAAVVALWPSYFFVAHYAWSEALFRLVFATHVWALLRLVQRPRIGWATLFATSAAALYAVHPKALLILLLAPVALVVLRVMRALDTRALLVAVLAFVLAAAGALLAMDALRGALWHAGGHSTATALLARLLNPEALLTGLAVMLGQVWYQLAASLGLAALGIWFVLRVATGGSAPALRLATGYVLAAVLVVGLASVAQMLDPQRVDHVAYGRYVDGASLVLIWLGLCWLTFGERGEGQRIAGWIAVGTILAAGVVLTMLPIVAGLEPAHPNNVAGIGWIFRIGSTPLQFFGVNSLFVAVATGLLLVLNRAGQIALAAVFAIGSGAIISAFTAHQAQEQLAFLSADAAVIRSEAPVSLYWTDAVRDHNLWSYHLQYTLATSFLDADGPLPAGAGLISHEPAAEGLACAARLPSGLFLLTNPTDAEPRC